MRIENLIYEKKDKHNNNKTYLWSRCVWQLSWSHLPFIIKSWQRHTSRKHVSNITASHSTRNIKVLCIYLSLPRYSLSAWRLGTHHFLQSIGFFSPFWHDWVNTIATPVVGWVNSYQHPAPNHPRDEETKLKNDKSFCSPAFGAWPDAHPHTQKKQNKLQKRTKT